MPERVSLRDLTVRAGDRVLVEGVGLDLDAGEVVALVGASGSGKTLTARSLLGLAGPQPGVVRARLSITVGGRTLEPYQGLDGTDPSQRGWPRFQAQVQARFREVRGSVVGYLPQDARGALNPLRTVHAIVEEAIHLGRPAGDRSGALEPASTWLQRAGFRDPSEVKDLYPHQLSGGMAQRVCIAMTLARGSRFVIADEPTTGLDPTVQEEILVELCRTAAAGVGVLLITHDLRLVPRLGARTLIIHQGRIAEEAPRGGLQQVRSPQGRALVEATARVGGGLL